VILLWGGCGLPDVIAAEEVAGVVNETEASCGREDDWAGSAPGMMIIWGGRELLEEAFFAFLAFSFSNRFSAPEMFLCMITC